MRAPLLASQRWIRHTRGAIVLAPGERRDHSTGTWPLRPAGDGAVVRLLPVTAVSLAGRPPPRPPPCGGAARRSCVPAGTPAGAGRGAAASDGQGRRRPRGARAARSAHAEGLAARRGLPGVPPDVPGRPVAAADRAPRAGTYAARDDALRGPGESDRVDQHDVAGGGHDDRAARRARPAL